MAFAGVLVLVLIVALLCPRPCETARTENWLQGNGDECTAAIAVEPDQGNKKALQQLFDEKRAAGGILHNGFVEADLPPHTGFSLPAGSDKEEDELAKCTKADVCLLMRQLDVEFYQRARLGKLTDEDFRVSPTLVKLSSGNCFYEHKVTARSQDSSTLPVAGVNGTQRSGYPLGPRVDKGFRLREIKSKEMCSRRLGNVKVDEVSRDDRPRGCYYSQTPSSKKAPTKAFFNTQPTEVEAGIITGPGMSEYSQGKRLEYVQVCEMDRTFTPAAAAYYSPYKLKENMWQPEDNERMKMSTSCSFGMMSKLAKDKNTQSACAKILATQKWDDSPIKRTLMSTIANDWCPNVWKDSLRGDRTCQTKRSMSWTGSGGGAEEDGRAANLKDYEETMEKQRKPKQALTEDACLYYLEKGEDVTLASLLG